MRFSEVIDLSDADELPEGLYIRRRKGSKDNITEWSPRLEQAWKSAKEMRNKIQAENAYLQKLNPKNVRSLLAKELEIDWLFRH